jgi:hypothetical protein
MSWLDEPLRGDDIDLKFKCGSKFSGANKSSNSQVGFPSSLRNRLGRGRPSPVWWPAALSPQAVGVLTADVRTTIHHPPGSAVHLCSCGPLRVDRRHRVRCRACFRVRRRLAQPTMPDPARMVPALSARGGNRLGHRRNHSKGVCFTGVFDANGTASRFSVAPMLAAGRYAVVGRSRSRWATGCSHLTGRVWDKL